MPNNNEVLTYDEVAAQVALGNFKWAGTAQSGSRVATRAWYNSYVKNTGALPSDLKLADYGEMVASRKLTEHTQSLYFYSQALRSGTAGIYYGPVSVGMWIYPTVGSVAQVFGFGESSSPSYGWDVGTAWDGSAFRWYVWPRNGSIQNAQSFGHPVDFNAWQFIEVYMPAGSPEWCGMYKLKLDGTSAYTNAQLYIAYTGGMQFWLNRTQQFAGYIDDIKIWEGGRTSAQVASDYKLINYYNGAIHHHWAVEGGLVNSSATIPPTSGGIALNAPGGIGSLVPY